MRGLLGAIRRRLQGFDKPSAPAPFAVKCRCGRVVTGQRAVQAQILPCPDCSEPIFVFPRSPLPHVGGLPPGAAKPPASQLRFWLLPTMAAVGTLAVVVILIVVLLQKNNEAQEQSLEKPNDGDGVSPTTIEKATAEARKFLKEGSFRLARETLRPLVAEADRNPMLRQLCRETDLLADLLKLPLEEIIQQAQDVRPEEWKSQFADFQGRAVLFDDLVVCDPGPAGRFALVNYQIRVGDETVRVDLDQDLFRELSRAGRLQLGRPQRLVFGARLASIHQERNVWVIAFENDSTVLMTEEDALTACGVDIREPEMQRVLRDQREWVRRK